MPTIESVVSRTADSVVFRLSQSPTVASLAMPSEPRAPRVVERVELPAELSEAHIADIAALPEGRFALLLRDLRQVVVVRDGAVEKRFGRRGEGPGEFRNPLALEASDSGFAVLDVDAVELFTVDGTSVGRARLPWMPDWSLQMFREPHLFFRAPFQSGPEDVSRRITHHGTDYIVLAAERGASALPPAAGRTEHVQFAVFRLSSRTLAADSVASVRGPARTQSNVMVTDQRGQPMTNIQQPVNEPLFGPRPVVAGTSEWLAVFDPARGRVEISMLSWGERRIVTWPDAEVPLSDSARVYTEEWQIRDLVIAAPSDAEARRWARNGRRASFEQKLRSSQSISFSATLAHVAALFATGRCLWLVGIDPRDFSDGTGHWGIAVDVETGTVSGPHRLATRGSQLKDVGYGFAYATSRTQDGEFIVERTPLPACTD